MRKTRILAKNRRAYFILCFFDKYWPIFLVEDSPLCYNV